MGKQNSNYLKTQKKKSSRAFNGKGSQDSLMRCRINKAHTQREREGELWTTVWMHIVKDPADEKRSRGKRVRTGKSRKQTTDGLKSRKARIGEEKISEREKGRNEQP